MTRYALTPRARAGLRETLEYVEREFGPLVTDDVIDRISAALELVAETPSIGHVREDITRNKRVRFWSVGPTLIAYRAADEMVQVLFIERGDQNWERLFAGTP